MKGQKKISAYMDKCFAAMNCPGCAWGAFFPFFVECVEADGGQYDPTHRIVEFPPAITGNGFCPVPESELLKMFL